ncbi:MAG: hypothetical protein SGILL_006118 [Bacillariaceae sp.]
MTDPTEDTTKTSSTKDDGEGATPKSDPATIDAKKNAIDPHHAAGRTDAERILDMEEKANKLDDVVAKHEVMRGAAKNNNDPSSSSPSPRKKRKKSRASKIEDAFQGCSECCGDCCVGCECVIS